MSGLILGGIKVPLTAALELAQSYEPIGGVSTRRALNGTAIRREHWRRLKTSISGSGWIPAGLQALDYSQPLTLACIAPRSIASATHTATLPAARRADTGFTPYAWAVLSDGTPQSTPVELAGHVATATTVAGAISYLFFYFPTLTVYADPPTERFDRSGATAGWELNAEEI